MSKVEPEPLAEVDPLLAGYAAALREHDTPSDEEASVTWAALEAQTRTRPRSWLPIAIAAAAVVVGALLIGPFSRLREAEQQPASEAPYRTDDPQPPAHAETKARAPVRPKSVPSTAPAPPASVTAPAPEPVAPAAKPKRPKPEAAATAPSSLAQETLLLRKIQRAHAAQQHRRVLALTAEHAKRFPTGTFAAERSLARVRALCNIGRLADARSARDRFVEAHPSSHLVPQFQAVCAD